MHTDWGARNKPLKSLSLKHLFPAVRDCDEINCRASRLASFKLTPHWISKAARMLASRSSSDIVRTFEGSTLKSLLRSRYTAPVPIAPRCGGYMMTRACNVAVFRKRQKKEPVESTGYFFERARRINRGDAPVVSHGKKTGLT